MHRIASHRIARLSRYLSPPLELVPHVKYPRPRGGVFRPAAAARAAAPRPVLVHRQHQNPESSRAFFVHSLDVRV